MTSQSDETRVSVEAGQHWQHVKRGTSYEIVGVAELQTCQPQCDYAELAIYRGEDGHLWACNTGEFTDGRFRLQHSGKVATGEWPLRARAWTRTSVEPHEKVLEIEGVIGDTHMTCRHTQTTAVADEDVPGLPELYAPSPDVSSSGGMNGADVARLREAAEPIFSHLDKMTRLLPTGEPLIQDEDAVAIKVKWLRDVRAILALRPTIQGEGK